MSESDDTDVLLLIPPDAFHVPSSDSDSSSNNLAGTNGGKTGVISEIVGHMQSLDSRITAIESKDNSLDISVLNNSLDSQSYGTSYLSYRQTLPRTKFSVSQSASLQNTPVKPRKFLSVPCTPSECSSYNYSTCFLRNDMKSGLKSCFSSIAKDVIKSDTNTLTPAQTKHDALTSYSDTSVVPFASCGTGSSSHVAAMPVRKESHLSVCPNDQCLNKSNLYCKPYDSLHSMIPISNLSNASLGQRSHNSRIVQEMELAEVDELLQEMEATELELSKRINSTCGYQHHNDPVNPLLSSQPDSTINNREIEAMPKLSGVYRKLDYQSCSKDAQFDVLSTISEKKSSIGFPDISLPYSESSQLELTDKIISKFKTWENNVQPSVRKPSECTTKNAEENMDRLSNVSLVKVDNVKSKEPDQNILYTSEANTNAQYIQSKPFIPANPMSYINESVKSIDVTPAKTMRFSNTEHNNKETSERKNIAHAGTNTDFHLRNYQRFLSLSDFWNTNTTRSQEETFRIKLEEEKFRREHCEQLIQELQKRLLEQQEKVAVAVRVDNEKNTLISQFHVAWSKLKQQLEILEAEHKNSQINLQDVIKKHQSEFAESQTQVKRLEQELSKALDLAAGYKEKSDTIIKEKIDLLKNHADELECYKTLVQEAENRYEQIKTEFSMLLEKNQQSEETLKTVQSDLNKERLRGSEVRSEMAVIHKALDACEAELIILKQEKENLQLKLKEEKNRNSILEQKNLALLASIDDAKKAEKSAKDETKSLTEQKEKIRAELQKVYQKQVDEVVKAKLLEFQTQLDAAESEFLEELKTRHQIIAECAAKKIKDVIDKHRLEIKLLEEKHKEEKRLYELQLAQTVQRASILETHLNSQRTTKSQLAEQLHSVMQKQWQQALHIISGGNTDNLSSLERLHTNKLFDCKDPKKSESMSNCYTKLSQESVKHITQLLETQNLIHPREDQNESMVTMNSAENAQLTNRNESKDDLRKYVKMIAEMQLAREDIPDSRKSISSPPLVYREVPRKHYLKKELSIMSEDSVTWQPVSETSTGDNVTEYIPISQKAIMKIDQQKNKPPWK